jgi:DNA repair protein RecO (recombination protein O)
VWFKVRTVITLAIILKRINFGEADRILTVITSDQGKISLLAKGVRRSKSKLAGGLELFSVSDISFIDGNSELKTVVSTQLVRHYGKIVGSMQTTMIAYDFLKLVDQHTQESCDPMFFDLLDAGLQALCDHHESPEIVQAWFCCRLLQASGSSINVEQQIGGQPFDEQEMYQFNFVDMGFFANPSGVFTPKHIKLLRLLTKVSKPANLLQISDATELAKTLQPLLTHALKSARY